MNPLDQAVAFVLGAALVALGGCSAVARDPAPAPAAAPTEASPTGAAGGEDVAPAPSAGRPAITAERDAGAAGLEAEPPAADDLTAALDAGIRRIDDEHFEIDRALVERLRANPTVVATGARVVPAIKDGQPSGFKLYAIRPSSLYARLGLQNGDTISEVNGFPLTTPAQALEAYEKVRESTHFTVTVSRRGAPMSLNYTIQ